MRKNRASKTYEQSKLVHIISAPIRALGMARDLYVKSMEGCAGRTTHGGAVGFAAAKTSGGGRLPKSFGKGGEKSDEELIRELLGARTDRFLAEGLRRRRLRPAEAERFGGGGLGRIDENCACGFEEACGRSYYGGVVKMNNGF